MFLLIINHNNVSTISSYIIIECFLQSLQSSLQPVPTNPGYIWATMPSAPDVVYQTPQTYQGAELADAAFVEGTTVEVTI